MTTEKSTTQTREPIPEHVLFDLETARLIGSTNMLDKAAVTRLTTPPTRKWLRKNDDRFMEALKAMGARRGKP